MNVKADAPMEGTPLIRPSMTEHPLYDAVVEACRTVYAPEIPVNVFDLGLVYTIEISDEGDVTVAMLLSAGTSLLVVAALVRMGVIDPIQDAASKKLSAGARTSGS